MAAIRAAASSMPRGSPSRVAQIRITASAVCSSKIPNPGRTPRARSTNKVTASDVTPSTASGGTVRSASPGARRCSREVARTRGTSERARISPIASAAAASTCSQLSTTTSTRRPANASATVSMTRAPPCGVMPRAVAIASGTASASPTGASSTSHTPSGNSSASSAATSRASRVFPTPPTPLRVTSGRERTSEATSDRTRERPTRVVGERGRFPRPACTLTASVWHRRRGGGRIGADDWGRSPMDHLTLWSTPRASWSR